VHQRVHRELAEASGLRRDLAEHQLETELEAIDFVLRGLAPRVEKGDPQAAASYLRAMERRAKLLGLDAPTKTDVTSGGQAIVPVTPDDPRWRELQQQHLGAPRQGVDDAARPHGDADPVAAE